MGRHGPQSLDAFLKKPREVDWLHEVYLGWPGPDGSSMSTDTICGVRIGVTSNDYEFADLPANRHDWYYRLARRHQLPEEWRVAADMMYRDMCIARCKRELVGAKKAMWPIAWARCHARYAALRTGAKFAWTRVAKIRQDRWHGAG